MRLEWLANGQKQTLSLDDPEYFIGSHPGCRIKVEDGVQTIHAALLKMGDTYEIEPREIEFIRINGESYSEAVPLFGSIILTIGDLQITVVDDEDEDENQHGEQPGS